jgi:hypothetical protein
MEQTSRNEQTSENTAVVKEYTKDLQEILGTKNSGSKVVGAIVSPFFLIGRRNRFAAFAVNSTGDKVHYILADGLRLDKRGVPVVVLHSDNPIQFEGAVLEFQRMLEEAEARVFDKKTQEGGGQ